MARGPVLQAPGPVRPAALQQAREGRLAREQDTGAGADPPRDGIADDAVLLAAAARGDAGSFRLLVVRHLPSALAVARRMLRDDAEAEDIAQEALVRLWRSARDIELGPGGVKPWLRRVATNLCIDRLRAAGRITVTDEVPEQQVPAGQLAALSGKDLAARVQAALRALPDRQRLALTLFHYEGLSQIEVGRAMGVSDEAVESLLGRARRALKGMLRDEWRELLPEAND